MDNSTDSSKTAARQDSVWRSVCISIEPGFEDILTSCIFESGFSGLEEHMADDRILIHAYYHHAAHSPDQLEQFKRSITEIPAFKKSKLYEILSVEDIPDQDWEKNWRRGLKAIEIGSRFVVRPSWIDYTTTGSRIEIIIDPKMAFGTGGHATTRLCMEMLENINPGGLTVIDAGCGSGILSIAAAKLGALSVFGFDHDSFSVGNALENIRLNGVEDSITIVEADIMAVAPEPADLVLANMISGTLIPGLPKLNGFLKPEGTVVFSGLLAEEETLFTDALENTGMKIIKKTQADEWIAVKAVGDS